MQQRNDIARVWGGVQFLSGQLRLNVPASSDDIGLMRARLESDGAISMQILDDCATATRLPAQDLARARRFYSEKLGLEPIEERPGGLRYRSGTGFFVVFESVGVASGTHTQMGWEVADLEATMATLRARGVVFEEYDLPGLETVNGVAHVAGNYPSKGVAEKGAWFKDSEGNLLALGQPVR